MLCSEGRLNCKRSAGRCLSADSAQLLMRFTVYLDCEIFNATMDAAVPNSHRSCRLGSERLYRTRVRGSCVFVLGSYSLYTSRTEYLFGHIQMFPQYLLFPLEQIKLSIADFTSKSSAKGWIISETIKFIFTSHFVFQWMDTTFSAKGGHCFTQKISAPQISKFATK